MNKKEIVIIGSERFLTRFYYDSVDNKMGENLFFKYNLPKGIVLHKNLAERLYSLVPVLENLQLKFLFTDVYRPVEMQQFLYEHWKERTGEEPKISLANVEKAPHPRGIACDCVLCDEQGNKLPLPSSSINYKAEERNPDYEFNELIPEEKEKKNNRDLLRTLMLCAGISPINKEWFHFQLPESDNYEPITVEEAKKAVPLEYNENYADKGFYNIFHDYQNDEFESKTHFWINNEQYFEQFERIGLVSFIEKIKEDFNYV